MLRLAFGRPWRQTEGMLGSIIDLLGLELAGAGPYDVLPPQRRPGGRDGPEEGGAARSMS